MKLKDLLHTWMASFSSSGYFRFHMEANIYLYARCLPFAADRINDGDMSIHMLNSRLDFCDCNWIVCCMLKFMISRMFLFYVIFKPNTEILNPYGRETEPAHWTETKHASDSRRCSVLRRADDDTGAMRGLATINKPNTYSYYVLFLFGLIKQEKM